LRDLSNILTATSFKIGNLIVPRSSLQEVLAISVRPLLLGDEQLPGVYGKRGTCTLVKNASRTFAVFTRHQLAGASPDTVRIPMTPSGKYMFPLDRFVFENSNLGIEEYEDLCAVRVWDEEVSSEKQVGFIDVSETPRRPAPKLFLCIGCPNYADSIDYEKPHIHIVTVSLPCSLDTEFETTAHHLQRLRVLPSSIQNLDYDGLSGGAVFSVSGGLQSFAIAFEGIVVRGGSGFLYFVESTIVKLLVGEITQLSSGPSGLR
jgi:hypothetical protein